MGFLVGAGLALSVGLSATFLGLDRDRAFYPTIMIVIASYYGLFAVMAGSVQILALESIAIVTFLAASIAGFKRSLLFENLTVVDQRIAASGASASARFDSPASAFDASISWQHLSDGNAWAGATIAYSRVVNERLRGLRAMVWTEALAYRRPSASYYAPSRQLRIDAGMQYSYEFRVPHFSGDRRNALEIGYLIGADVNGVIYQHPSLHLALEFARGIALDARAEWVRSDVYTERSASVGLTIVTARRR